MTTKNEQNDKYEFTVAVTIPGKDKNDNYYTRCAFVRGHRLSAAGAANSATNTNIYTQALMRRASTCVLLVDSFKLGKNSVCDFAKLTEFDRIITDDKFPCPPDILEVLENSNTELTIVHCEE